MSVTFGPIQSWRLGRALGVDLVFSDHKYCTFDCRYCPEGRHSLFARKRHWYAGMSAVECGLRSVGRGEADCVTFAGKGEPTLASNLAESIDLARRILCLPVAVATNSSLMPRDDVKRDLAKADTVIAKLDAYDEESFLAINRPLVPCKFAEIVDALREFREGFGGRLALHLVLWEGNRQFAARMAAIVRRLSPDEVQISTRTSWLMAGETSEATEAIHASFAGLNARCVHTDLPSWTLASDLEKLEHSRPNAAVMLTAVAAGSVPLHLN